MVKILQLMLQSDFCIEKR